LEKVAGELEVDQTDDSHQIVITHPGFRSDKGGLFRIKLLPRHARHLANVLIEQASYAEAESEALQLLSRPYRRKNKPRMHVRSLPVYCQVPAIPGENDLKISADLEAHLAGNSRL